MTTARWRQIEEIFQAAADLAPEERSAFLSQACNGDRPLLDEVQNLLAADSNIEGAVETSIRQEAASLAVRASESVVGRRIGPYRITALIGSGGMGMVYRATRDDNQFQKDVAIKIVKRGLDFEALLVRFRRERQILARLM